MTGNSQEYEKYFIVIYGIGLAILLLNIYYFCIQTFASWHLVAKPVTDLMLTLRAGGVFSSAIKTKLWAYILIVISCLPRTGKKTDMSLSTIVTVLAAGSVLLLLCPGTDTFGKDGGLPVDRSVTPGLYMLTAALGFAGTSWGASQLGRKLRGGEFNEASNDKRETFPQNEKAVDTPYSFNFPTKYFYKGKWHDGIIPVGAPFRSIAVYGGPGSGKSYSVYGPLIEQAVEKEYCIFLYDFKYPDLSKLVYNELLQKYPMVPDIDEQGDIKKDYLGKDIYTWNPKAPRFCVINFEDPTMTMRCNPIHSRYIKEATDAAEFAEVIMNNLSKGSKESKDFFDKSAELFAAAIILWLAKHEDGKYCSFPYFIELMNQNYEDVFELLLSCEETKAMIMPFANALAGGAQEQLQGQIASAQIPLNKFASPVLYWVMSGDDFDLNLNNPDDPKVICCGNEPARANIYSTALALYASTMFKQINHKGKHHSAILLDELPTFYLKGLDQVVNTARSNKVMVVIGAQDKTQLIRDYGKEYADVIFNTIGTVFFGAVKGETAKEFSNSFGKEFRRQESQTQSIDSESLNVSFQQQEILTVDVIESLSVGFFGGVVADDISAPVDKKFFLAQIQRDNAAVKEKEKNAMPMPVFNSFGKDRHYKMITDDADNMLLTHLMYHGGIVEELQKDGITPSQNQVETIASQRLGEMSKEDRAELLETVKEQSFKEYVDIIVQKNFLRIRKDAEMIIETEFRKMGKTPKGTGKKKTTGGTPINRTNKSNVTGAAQNS